MRKRRSLVARPPRHRLEIPCQVVRVKDFRLVSDTMANLSLDGMLTGAADPALTGEPLLVSFQLPRSGLWIDTDATIARVVHGRRPGDGTRALGIHFHALDPILREHIARQLRRSPPAPPLPRPGRRDAGPAVRALAVHSGWARSGLGHALIRWWPR
jgi:hypothetical protein